MTSIVAGAGHPDNQIPELSDPSKSLGSITKAVDQSTDERKKLCESKMKKVADLKAKMHEAISKYNLA